MRLPLRIYKDEYESLPAEIKVIQVNGKEEPGLKIGRREIKLSDIEMYDKGKAIGGAKHLAKCAKCGKWSIIYAHNKCASCYGRENFNKNHPSDEKSVIDIEKRNRIVEENRQISEIKEFRQEYPYNILLNTLGAVRCIEEFGPKFSKLQESGLDALYKIIGSLNDKYSKVISEYFIDNKTAKEIADGMGCTKSWISGMITRFETIILANIDSIKENHVENLVYMSNIQDTETSANKVYTLKRVEELASGEPEYTKEQQELRSILSLKAYRAVVKAGIKDVDELRKVVNDDITRIDSVKGVGMNLLTEIAIAAGSTQV